MFHLGLDVHSKWTPMVGLDPETGEVVKLEQIPNEGAALRPAVGGLAGPLHGVMEAGTNSWAMCRELRPLFHELTVADPAKLRNRRSDRGAKTDRRDPLRMAGLRKQAEWLERSHPQAAASLREGLEETFTINRLGLSPRLRRRWPPPM
jgi:transposase